MRHSKSVNLFLFASWLTCTYLCFNLRFKDILSVMIISLVVCMVEKIYYNIVKGMGENDKS